MGKLPAGRTAVNSPESTFIPSDRATVIERLLAAGVAAVAEGEAAGFLYPAIQGSAPVRSLPDKEGIVWLQRALEPDREQMATFIRGMFKNATPDAAVSLRAFLEDSPSGSKAFFIVRTKVTATCDELTEAAIKVARRAARAPEKVVFAPPIATFNHRWRAREEDLAEAPALSVECDARPASGRSKLVALLGPTTFDIASGGKWTNPETGEVEPKLHLHGRLTAPARTKDEHAMLKEARALATRIAGADASAVTAVHPLRWPGSWHRKAEPRLCRIVGGNPENEIELGAALKALKAAAPAAPDRKAAVKDKADRLAAGGNATFVDSRSAQLNEAAMNDLGAWVPDLFAGESFKVQEHGDGYRVWPDRDLDEAISIQPPGGKDAGIKDWGLFDDWGDADPNREKDPYDGGRNALQLVMEWLLEIPIKKIAAGKVSPTKYKKAFDWLADKVGFDAEVKQATEAVQATNVSKWRERNRYGMPVPSLHNARKAITDLGVTCSYDTFHSRMLFGFANDKARHVLSDGTVDDNAIVKLRQLLSDSFGFDMTEKHTRDGVISLALDHCFDPVCDMLDQAQADWDGITRLDRMAVDYFNCAETPLNRAVIRVMMIAAVRRARHPGCKYDTIVVLESEEGWNKSTALRILAGDDNFSDESILGKQSREVQEHLAEVWIHENADLAGMKKAESETVKAFASRISDNARPAYGHMLKKQKRHSIEVGTTNSSEYLPSQTGNRRFWPLKVLKTIDLDKLTRDRLQLWGEAATLEAEGASIVLDEKLWGAAGEQQEARRVKDNWEEIVRDMPTHVALSDHHMGRDKTEFYWLKDGAERGGAIQIIHREGDYEIVVAADVLRLVLGVSIDRQTTAHSMRLSTVMQIAGWGRGSSDGKFYVNGKRIRGFCRPRLPTPKPEKGRSKPRLVATH
jgi:hypothetical protein